MKKQYFVHYYRDFGNTYTLLYAECPEDFAALPENAERITRREAVQLCRDENDRRNYHASNSGYASNVIIPAAGDCCEWDTPSGYIMPRRRYGAKK